MAATLAPISAILDTYANGLRDHAVSAVCALFRRYLSVEESFLSQPSTDQAMAALVKANADSLDGVVATAIAHEALKARSALTITLLRQLYGFPERFGVAPLRELPESLDVVTELSKLSGRVSPRPRPQPRTRTPHPHPPPNPHPHPPSPSPSPQPQP